LTTDFMRAVGQGTLYATATPDHIGKTLAHVSMESRIDAIDGQLVARGLGTYRVYTKSLVKSGLTVGQRSGTHRTGPSNITR
jgi:acyl-coenzyme A thioesterase PaaI-like protein